MQFSDTWMGMKRIVLCEADQRKRGQHRMTSHIQDIKKYNEEITDARKWKQYENSSSVGNILLGGAQG